MTSTEKGSNVITEEQIQKLIAREQKRRAYAKAYRTRPGVQEATAERRAQRVAWKKEMLEWAIQHRPHHTCPQEGK